MGQHSGTLQNTWIDVNGLPVHTVASTDPVPPGAPAVVLVHGLGLSHRYMVPIAEQLASAYRVYAPDLPGFGDSGKPARALGVPGLADALAAWMGAAGLDGAVLLGNSFGCQIIVDLAARYPDRVGRVVLQGPTTDPKERSWFWQFVRWRQNSPYNPRALGPITRGDYRKCGLLRLFQTTRYFLQDRVEEKLPQVGVPALVVRGQRDPICRQRWAEAVTRRLPQGRLVVIPEVAHTLVYTASRELLGATRPFLDEARQMGSHRARRGTAQHHEAPIRSSHGADARLQGLDLCV